MDDFSKINKILITLSVADRQVLYIMMSKDGTLQRLGDGDGDTKEKDLFIGSTKEIHFYQLIRQVDSFILESCGRNYNLPDKMGRICNLRLLFDIDGEEKGFEVIYGEKSQGPPEPIRALVISAVQLTDKWFADQKQISKKNNQVNKKWWEIWK